jgi:hypothetical protein
MVGELLICILSRRSGLLLGLVESLTDLFHAVTVLTKSSLEGANGDGTSYLSARWWCNFALKLRLVWVDILCTI